MSTINFGVPTPILMVIANATPAERAQFKVLWQKHLSMRAQFKIVYYLPQSLGEKMGRSELVAMTDNLRDRVFTNAYLHCDTVDGSFRVGQVTDKADCDYVNQTILLYTALYIPPTPTASTVTSNGSIYGGVTLNTRARARPAIQGTSNGSIYGGVTLNTRTRARPAIQVTSNGSIYGGVTLNTRARARPANQDRVKKPRNSWVLYRQDKHQAAALANPGMHNSALSQVISVWWKQESSEVRQHYANRAQEEKINHQRLYPGYKLQPRKSSEIKKRNVKSKQVGITQPQAEVGHDFYPSDAVNSLFEGVDNVFLSHQSADAAGDATAKLFIDLEQMDAAGSATADLFNGLDKIFSEHQAIDVAPDATTQLFNDHEIDAAGFATAELFNDVDDIFAERQTVDVADTITSGFFGIPDVNYTDFEEIRDFQGDLDLDLPFLQLPEFPENIVD